MMVFDLTPTVFGKQINMGISFCEKKMVSSAHQTIKTSSVANLAVIINSYHFLNVHPKFATGSARSYHRQIRKRGMSSTLTRLYFFFSVNSTITMGHTHRP